MVTFQWFWILSANLDIEARNWIFILLNESYFRMSGFWKSRYATSQNIQRRSCHSQKSLFLLDHMTRIQMQSLNMLNMLKFKFWAQLISLQHYEIEYIVWVIFWQLIHEIDYFSDLHRNSCIKPPPHGRIQNKSVFV